MPARLQQDYFSRLHAVVGIRDLHGAPPPRHAAVYRGIYRGAGDYLAVLPRYGVNFSGSAAVADFF